MCHASERRHPPLLLLRSEGKHFSTGYAIGEIPEEIFHRDPAVRMSHPFEQVMQNLVNYPSPIVAAAGKIDVCLVGTGDQITHVPTPFRDALEAAGIGVDFMSSPQACRTYNVLLGEGRRVGLALLPVTG